MKPYQRARTPKELREVIQAAIIEARGNQTRAAKLLGMSRVHFYRLKEALGIGSDSETGVTPSDDSYSVTERSNKSDTVTPSSSVTPTDDVTPDDANAGNASVTVTNRKRLTYAGSDSTLSHVGSVAAVASAGLGTTDQLEETEEQSEVEVSVKLPKDLADWLELQALRDKQSGARSRMAKSPIMIKALRLYKRTVEGETDD